MFGQVYIEILYGNDLLFSMGISLKLYSTLLLLKY